MAATAPTPSTKDSQVLQGQLSDLRYYDPVGGQSALMLVTSDGTVQRCFGCLRNPIIGEMLTLTGQFTRHSTFGRTFTFDSYLSAPPPEQDAQARYLARMGDISVDLALTLLRRFGYQTFEIIEQRPEALLAVNNLTPEHAKTLHARLSANRGVEEFGDLLSEFALDKRQLAQLRQHLGSGDGLAAQLRQNPYLLSLYLPSVAFRQADGLAQRLKVTPNHPDRLACAILQVLRYYSVLGDTILSRAEVLSELPRLLGRTVPDDHPLLTQALERLDALGQVRIQGDQLALADILRAEHLLLGALQRLESGDRHFDTLISEERLGQLLGEHFPRTGALVQPVVSQVLHHKVSLVNGPHGPLAHTAIQALLKVFGKLNAQIHVVSPSLDTLAKLRRIPGLSVYLPGELVSRMPDGTPSVRQSHPLETDLLIITQAHAMGVRDLAQCLDALPASAGVLLMGDPLGAPSVGPGQVFLDLHRTTHFTTLTLAGSTSKNSLSALAGALCEPATPLPLPARATPGDPLVLLPSGPDHLGAATAFYRDYLPGAGFSVTQGRIYSSVPPEELLRTNLALQANFCAEARSIRTRTHELREGAPVYFARSSLEYHVPAGSRGQVVQISPGPRCSIQLADGRSLLLDVSALAQVLPGYLLPLRPLALEHAAVVMVIAPDDAPPPPRASMYELCQLTQELILVGQAAHFTNGAAPRRRRTRFFALLQEK